MATRTVFLSSTGRDLTVYRDAVYRAIEGLDGYHCVRMEDFGARDWAAADFCRAKVAACDVFVGIVGHVYGSCPPRSEQSFTEREYDAAVSDSKPRLMFLAPEDFPLPANLVESDEKRAKQRQFRERVNQERVRDAFRSPEELARQVIQALRNWEQNPPTGTGARHARRNLERAALLDRFLKSHVAEHAYLSMTGFETRMRLPVELERVLVPLRARVAAAQTERARSKQQPLAPGSEDGVIDFDQAWQRARSRKIPTLVVLGQPGSGKTTLLKHLLLRCAGNPEQLSLLPATVPLLLPLRQVHPRERLAKASAPTKTRTKPP